MKTLYDELRLVFGLTDDYPLAEVNVPFDIAMIDWAKAATFEMDRPIQSPRDAWALFMDRVRYRPDFVFEMTDPALHPLVSRLMDAGFLVLDSCSEHPGDINPYINMVFPSVEAGHRFLNRLRQIAQDLPSFDYFLRGWISSVVGSFGPDLDVETCIENQLPIHISMVPLEDDPTIRDALQFWIKLDDALLLGDGISFLPSQMLMSERSSGPSFDAEEIIQELHAGQIPK